MIRKVNYYIFTNNVIFYCVLVKSFYIGLIKFNERLFFSGKAYVRIVFNLLGGEGWGEVVLSIGKSIEKGGFLEEVYPSKLAATDG